MIASNWLRYALFTTVTWGVWGAYTSLPSEHGFPDTLTYVVWALTMIAPVPICEETVALHKNHERSRSKTKVI